MVYLAVSRSFTGAIVMSWKEDGKDLERERFFFYSVRDAMKKWRDRHGFNGKHITIIESPKSFSAMPASEHK